MKPWPWWAGLAFLFLIIACSIQPSREVVQIHRSVKSRVSYSNYNSYDYRYIPPGQFSSGNCAVFAYTAWTDLEKAGLPHEMVSCTTKEGQRHVYAKSGMWALDIRYKEPKLVSEIDCI